MGLSTEIIINPHGNMHHDGKVWSDCQREVLRSLAPAEVSMVESFEEAAEVARKSALRGYRRIIAAGGDEVVHGVVNGLMGLTASHRANLVMGLLSLGALDSFSRTLNMPAGFPRQLELLKAAHTLPFDVGRVSCHDSRGQPVTRYFLNGARLGLPGELRGELRDLLRRPRAALAGIGEVLKRHLRKSESLVMSGEERVLYHGPSPLVLIMGGRYYPGLGDTVPQGRQGDGLLQVGWIESEGLLGGVPRLISLHLPWPLRRRLSRWRSLEYFSVAPDSGRCSLELDGQPAGYLPAEFSMERKALHLIVEPVAARLGERVESLAGRMKEKGLVGSAMGRNSA